MNQEAGYEMYRTALHREPENTTTPNQWNGQTPAQALKNVRGAEWTIQDKFLKETPALIGQMQNTINGLSSRPTNLEYATAQADLSDAVKQIADLHTALEAERSKPPVEVIKEVTKEVEPGWLTTAINFVRKLLRIQ